MNNEGLQETAEQVKDIKDEIFLCSVWLDEMIDKVDKLLRESGRL